MKTILIAALLLIGCSAFAEPSSVYKANCYLAEGTNVLLDGKPSIPLGTSMILYAGPRFTVRISYGHERMFNGHDDLNFIITDNKLARSAESTVFFKEIPKYITLQVPEYPSLLCEAVQ